MNAELKNIILYAIAIVLLVYAVSFLLFGNHLNLAAFAASNAILLTPKIPTPKWLDILVFCTAMATFGYLANVA